MFFGAFVSEQKPFSYVPSHRVRTVRSRRWSKVWSSPFEWDQNAIRKSRIRLRINSFSAVIIAYFKVIVKSLLSTLKICIAEDKEKGRVCIFSLAYKLFYYISEHLLDIPIMNKRISLSMFLSFVYTLKVSYQHIF